MIRVVRTITYEGPEERVERVLSKSLGEGLHNFGNQLLILVEQTAGPHIPGAYPMAQQQSTESATELQTEPSGGG